MNLEEFAIRKLVISRRLFEELIHYKTSNVGEYAHVCELDHRPFPAFGLAINYSQRTHALHRESVKDHQ
jgi:hypothetical protein